MSDNEDEKQPLKLTDEVRDMKIEPDASHVKEESVEMRLAVEEQNGVPPSSTTRPQNPLKLSPHDIFESPKKSSSLPQSPAVKSEQDDTMESHTDDKAEPGQATKLSRSSSKRAPSRPPPLFLDLPDVTSLAGKGFEHIKSCIYANKYIGTTDHAMECECTEEWDGATQTNHACGEDSDCINRATKMECTGECNCGRDCQNQRFQRRQYADVAVIKTEKKGYGLRANTPLQANTFIFEYIGEVIGEAAFRRRMIQYDEEGIKHFYFMSLNKGEFVDATKRGNLGRFCNHSCNPNCYVDKWVVGDKLRMGIFAERKIAAGEELVFNYNVDRYGANPQPCYCGEPNCTGFIGGKTQTERATKLPAATIEALGIDDGDGWDLAVAKKARKKKPGEDDEEYVDRMQPKSLDEGGVVKVMATLMQCKEKWIAVKLLSRIQQCGEERVRNRVVKMHGYQILKSQLAMWIEDTNIVLQILDILNGLPRITRNKIQDSGIEATVEKLLESEDELVKERASAILKIWSALEIGYRIPRHKRDPAAAEQEWEERRRQTRDRSKSPSKSRSVSPDVPKGPSAPSGPRAGNARNFHPGRPAPFRRPFGPSLPAGWFQAQSNGKTYYYSASGQTTWSRPTVPATQPPPPPKVATNEQKLQDIINSITAAPKEKTPAPTTPQPDAPKPTNHEREKPKEKWRSYDEEKRKKIYENTLAPHVMSVIDKFKGKLPKDDLKRFGKEVSKKLVASDFKNNRVEDPTQISSKQEKGVKKFAKEFFEKAVKKRRDYEKLKAEKEARKSKQSATSAEVNGTSTTPPGSPPRPTLANKDETLPFSKPADDDVLLSEHEIDDDDDEPSPSTQDDSVDAELKRKREAEETPLTGVSPDVDVATPRKRMRSDSETMPTPPPPPPPPPPSMPFDGDSPYTREEGDVEEGINNDTNMQENSAIAVDTMDGDELDRSNKNALNGFDEPFPTPNSNEMDAFGDSGDQKDLERINLGAQRERRLSVSQEGS